MKLLPSDKFLIQSPDPLPLIVEKLAAHIQSPKLFRWSFSQDHSPYSGTISESGFEIHRTINYRNSFLPIIRGEFDQLPSGTLIHIKMGLHPVTTAFLIVWFLIWYSFSIPFYLSGAMPFEIASLFLGMPLALLLIFWCAFWYEAKRSRRELTEIILSQKTRWQTADNSKQWILKAVQWSLSLFFIALFLKQVITKYFYPYNQSESPALEAVSCSQNSLSSPYCNFSLVRTLTEHPLASALAISADGQTLVSGGSDKAIKVWDLTTGQLKKTLQSDSGKILAVAISPDGKTVVSGSADRMARIWKLTGQQKPLMLKGHQEEVKLVGITPDGKTIITGSYGAVKMWDLTTGELKATLPNLPKSEIKIGPLSIIDDDGERFRPLAINPNNSTAILDFFSGVKLWDLTTNQQKALLNEKFDTFAGSLLSAYISPDGKLAALQYTNSVKKFETRLKVWDLTSAKVKAQGSTFFSRHTFVDIPLALSQDHIFGSITNRLKIWNLETAQLEAVFAADSMSSLVVSADGKLLAGITGDPYLQNAQIPVWKR